VNFDQTRLLTTKDLGADSEEQILTMTDMLQVLGVVDARFDSQSGAFVANRLPSIKDTAKVPVNSESITVAYSNAEPSGKTHIENDDERLTYYGLVRGARSVSGNPCVINLSNGYTGDPLSNPAAPAYAPFQLAFDFYGDEFVLMTMPLTNSDPACNVLWIWVDGQPATAAPAAQSSLTVGGGTFTKVTFTSVAQRRIVIWVSMYTPVCRLYIDHVDAVSPIPAAGRPRVQVLGDSWVEGTGTTGLRGMTDRLRLLTGWDVYQAGQGGTGYVNPGPGGQQKDVYGSESRLAGIAGANPDYIIVFGTTNDDSEDPDDVGAAAFALYSTLAARESQAQLIVVGPEQVSETISAPRMANRDAVRAACSTSPNVMGFVDPLADNDGNPWISGTGSSTSPASDGNADVFSNGAVPSHLTTAGHDYYARRILKGVVDLLAGVY
jgi:hypothetical protein